MTLDTEIVSPLAKEKQTLWQVLETSEGKVTSNSSW
jgi:hypothetical protein